MDEMTTKELLEYWVKHLEHYIKSFNSEVKEVINNLDNKRDEDFYYLVARVRDLKDCVEHLSKDVKELYDKQGELNGKENSVKNM